MWININLMVRKVKKINLIVEYVKKLCNRKGEENV